MRVIIYAADLNRLLATSLVLVNLYLFLSLFHVNVSNSILAIEDLGNLFEGGAFSLREDEVDPDRFEDIPKLQVHCKLVNRGHQRRRKI